MLEQFPHIVDVDFSAQMEKNLDKIESGKADWRQTVDAFYKGFDASLQAAEKNMEGKKIKVPDEPSSEVCPLCGRPMVIKVGKYGKFLACSGFPECRGTKRLVKDHRRHLPQVRPGPHPGAQERPGPDLLRVRRYPDCDFMTWDTPVAQKCEKVRLHPVPPRFPALLRPKRAAALRCRRPKTPDRRYYGSISHRYPGGGRWPAARPPSGWPGRGWPSPSGSRSRSAFPPPTKTPALPS